jgi:hypothetical protein
MTEVLNFLTYRVLDKQKGLRVIELPAGIRTLKILGHDIRKKGALRAMPKTLQLPFTQLIVTSKVVFATQSVEPMESYNSQVTFPLVPNIYNNFSFCTGELEERSDKEIADSFFLSEWGLPDLWSCKIILPKVFKEATPQLSLRAWENITKVQPELMFASMKQSCSFVPFHLVVKAKVELDHYGNIVPVQK